MDECFKAVITLQQGQKNWSCPHKQQARQATIIQPYRKLFGNTLPPNKQYWTLCGEMAKDNTILDGCELSQMVQEDLISPDQFHGVEGNSQIHQLNIQALANSPLNTAHLYNEEFTKVLDITLGCGNLNPGIVYLDTIQGPKKAVSLLSTTLDILNQINGPMMVVWNFIKENKYRGVNFSWEHVESIAKKNYLYQNVIQNWKQFGQCTVFQYGGTGKSSTTMGSVVFYK